MDARTVESYNAQAEQYDNQTVSYWERFPSSFLQTFAEKIRGPVLDIGSGPGRDGLLLKQRGLDITCLDASQAMVNLCRARGLKTMIGDFMALPFPATSFSGVWAYTSLLHVPRRDFDRPIQEIQRVLVPGGTLALGMIGGDFEGYRASERLSAPRYFTHYTKEEVIARVSQHGFTVLFHDQIVDGDKTYLHFLAEKL